MATSGGAAGGGVRVVNGDPDALGGRRHAGHDDLTLFVVVVLELLDGALAARADGMHRGMPAEVRDVEAERQAGLEKVLAVFDLVRGVVNEDRRHQRLHWE